MGDQALVEEHLVLEELVWGSLVEMVASVDDQALEEEVLVEEALLEERPVLVELVWERLVVTGG